MVAAAAIIAVLVLLASRGAPATAAPAPAVAAPIAPTAPDLGVSAPVAIDVGILMPAATPAPTSPTVALAPAWQAGAVASLEALELAARDVAPWALTVPPRVAVALGEARAGEFERTRLAVALLSLPLTPDRALRPAAARADAALADARAAVARPTTAAGLPAGPLLSLPLGRFT